MERRSLVGGREKAGGSPSALPFTGMDRCRASLISLVAIRPILSPLALSFDWVLAGRWVSDPCGYYAGRHYTCHFH